VAASISTFAPPTAISVQGQLKETSSAQTAILAPNNAYGAVGSTTNPPSCVADNAGAANSCTFDLILESTDLFWASSGGGGLIALQGWRDSVNAN